MLKKHKILLSILQEFNGKIDNEKFNILLFIYSNEFENKKNFNFININNLPFSLTLLEDKKYLIAKNYLMHDENWNIQNTKKRFIFDLDMFEKFNIQTLKNNFANKNLEELKNYFTEKYKSDFTSHNNKNKNILYTIGYESISLEEYLNKLKKENIKVLCDVRKNAYSQKFGFSKKELQYGAKLLNINYIHIPNLGIEPENRQNLKDKFDYFCLFQRYRKSLLQKINDTNHLLQLLKNSKKIALTCFEKDFKMCHRYELAKFIKNKSDFKFDIINL